MSIVVAMDDLDPNQKLTNPRSRPGAAHTDFIKLSADTPDSPSAYLIEQAPGRLSSAHYHAIDQFQIVTEGKGKFGRREVTPYSVHFVRAYTPYGPLLPDKETGWAFLTLRTHYDPGAQHLPEKQDKLKQIPNRRPWQITKNVTFPAQASGISLQDIPDIKDDQGLFARTLSMPPNTYTVAPDPSGGDGQFVVVTRGSLMYDNREHKALAVVFVKPEENAFHIHAGAQGLQGLILNFPQSKLHARNFMTPPAAVGFKKWQCMLCAFVYDESLGMPEEGIAAGTRWQDVPDSWNCPDCGAAKIDFEMVEV